MCQGARAPFLGRPSGGKSVVLASQIYAGALQLLAPSSARGSESSRSGDTWVSLVRVLVLLTLIPASWFGILSPSRPIAHADLTGVVLLFGAYVVLLTVGPRYLAVLRKTDLIIVFDIVMVALVMVVSGDLDSPFRYLFYLTILEAAMRLNLRQALAASLAIAAVVILLWAHAGRGDLLRTLGFEVGAFIAGGFFLALCIGTLIQEHRASLDLAQAYDTALEGWSHALDLRDRESPGHAQRVTKMTMRLARAMGVPREELIHIRRGALLHDIGMMAISDSILFKPGPLTDEEWEVMRCHPAYAHDLLFPIPYLRPALDIPYCHHEKWDGTGYPRGLRGEQIPLPARIFAVADVWDALRSERPYGSVWPEDKARDYIREQAGKHFDPRIVEVFLRLEGEAHTPPEVTEDSGTRDEVRPDRVLSSGASKQA
jgi:hypothetical protein